VWWYQFIYSGYRCQESGKSTRKVSLFRAKHSLEGDLWFIKILGTTYGQMRVWIREDKRYYGEGYTINDTLDAGIRVTEIWETLLNKPGGRS